ncbi:MAG: hypothetical protein DI551_04615 [Micavibrio aeruginosavorus]|uniref:DUF1566 domain-containing protein n=1 Tax=Micavibrio aeruginosavorus TaxID=349221 RepID=A0A2W5N2Y5_9BACT|nr:MAG: hypothetical protein DI551_04615 [Micavibrio aeruginosavorus]
MRTNSQRGSAIWMLFIAVALFGLISYVFLQNSRGNTSTITGVASEAQGYQSQDCTNAINMAVKRLQSRGCANVSYNNDGSDDNEGAPKDGSCAVFHPNGGGAKPCNNLAVTPLPCGASAEPGDICPDGSVYAGDTPDGNVQMFTTGASVAQNHGSWNDGSTNWVETFITDANTGKANTSALGPGGSQEDSNTDPGIQGHYQATQCANLVAHGHDDWYLPALEELQVMYDNKDDIGDFNADEYFSSTESHAGDAFAISFVDGTRTGWRWKRDWRMGRCVRTNP